MALRACCWRFGSRPSYISTGSSAGVFIVVGIPRARITLRALEPTMRTLAGSDLLMRMVACVLRRLNVLPPMTSAPSCLKSLFDGLRLNRYWIWAGLRVPDWPLSDGWQVAQVR